MYHPTSQMTDSKDCIKPFPAAFPQELLDRFVDCLAAEYHELPRSHFKRTNTPHEINTKALLNCSQASSTLYCRATKGLFSRLFIKIASQDAPRRFAALVKILTPSLATSSTGVRLGVAHHIAEFSILLYGRSCFGVGDPNTCPAKGDAVKALNDDSLVSILSKLQTAEYGITKFSLTWGTSCCQISWANLSPQIQRSFRDLILSPHLSRLELVGEFSNLPGSIFSGSKIRQLQVNSLNFESDHQAEPAVIPPVGLPNLESFHTNYSFDIDLSPTTSPLMELKKLKAINITLGHLTRTESILRLATNSLQNVTVQFYLDIPRFLVDFSSMPNLKRLSILQVRDTFSSTLSINDPVINTICDSLEGDAPWSSLVSLKLHIRLIGLYGHPDPYVLALNSGSESHWKRIDGIVSTAERFPALKDFRVKLTVETIMGNGDRATTTIFQGVRSSFKASFPRISASTTIRPKITLDGRLHARTAMDCYQLIEDIESDSEREEIILEM